MRSPAEKLEMLLKLFEAGLLCECSKYEHLINDETGEVTIKMVHASDCKARVTAVLLLEPE